MWNARRNLTFAFFHTTSQVVYVDEWCTSCTCAGCHSRLRDNLRKSWKLKGCVNPLCPRTA